MTTQLHRRGKAPRAAPAEVVALLNRFVRPVVDDVNRRRGLLNKFEGDAAGDQTSAEPPGGDVPILLFCRR